MFAYIFFDGIRCFVQTKSQKYISNMYKHFIHVSTYLCYIMNTNILANTYSISSISTAPFVFPGRSLRPEVAS